MIDVLELQAGKHVLVEKPLTTTTREAEAVVTLAQRNNRMLMVGHTFLFEPAVERLRDLVADGELGDIWHVTSERLNLGLFRRDANVLCDLAPPIRPASEPNRASGGSGESARRSLVVAG